MIKQRIILFILIIGTGILFWGCEAMATLFHGEKPEAPPVTYTVTFNANGASGTPPETQTVNDGAVINLPDKGSMSSTGNIFAGWNENASGGGTTYSVGASVTVIKDMVFYAQWFDSSTPQYTVTFNANGATSGAAPAPQTVYNGISITVPGQGTLAYNGKTFGGWNTQADGGGTNYAVGAFYTVTEPVTLYARWQSVVQLPGSVTASAISSDRIQINWNDVTGAINYKVYRSATVSGSYQLISTCTSTSYTDTDLSPLTTYYYRVSALTSIGESEQSSPVSAMTPAETPLQPPTSLNASTLSNSIRITWISASGATSYKVYRSSSAAGPYTFLGSASVSPYTDSGLSAGTTYYYKVSSVKGGEESGLSDYVMATTQNEGGGTIDFPPTTPTGLVVSSVSSGSITLSWNSVSTASSYNVYRSNALNAAEAKINTGPVTDTSYTDSVPAGAAYYYKVVGVNSSGESPRSAGTFAYASSHYTLSYYAGAQTLSLAASGKHYYRLAVTQGNSYTIEWQNGNNQNTAYYFRVYAWQNNGTSIFSDANNGYTNPRVFTATATGFVTIEVQNRESSSQNYQIYYY